MCSTHVKHFAECIIEILVVKKDKYVFAKTDMTEFVHRILGYKKISVDFKKCHLIDRKMLLQ